MYSPTPQDFTNYSACQQQLSGWLFAGPFPAAIEPKGSATPLPPLPAGVTFAASGTGAVCFAGAKNPTKPHVWSGAAPSLQKGDKPYAYVQYNTITADREEQFGWLIAASTDVTASPNILTGGMTYTASSTVVGEDVIPAHYNTVELALQFLAQSNQ